MDFIMWCELGNFMMPLGMVALLIVSICIIHRIAHHIEPRLDYVEDVIFDKNEDETIVGPISVDIARFSLVWIDGYCVIFIPVNIALDNIPTMIYPYRVLCKEYHGIAVEDISMITSVSLYNVGGMILSVTEFPLDACGMYRPTSVFYICRARIYSIYEYIKLVTEWEITRKQKHYPVSDEKNEEGDSDVHI